MQTPSEDSYCSTAIYHNDIVARPEQKINCFILSEARSIWKQISRDRSMHKFRIKTALIPFLISDISCCAARLRTTIKKTLLSWMAGRDLSSLWPQWLQTPTFGLCGSWLRYYKVPRMFRDEEVVGAFLRLERALDRAGASRTEREAAPGMCNIKK